MDKIKKIIVDTEKKVININGQDFSSVSYFNLEFDSSWHLEVKHSFNYSGEPVVHRNPHKTENTTAKEAEIADKLLELTELAIMHDVDIKKIQKIATDRFFGLSSGKNEA